MRLSLKEVAEIVQGKIFGDSDVVITGVNEPELAGQGEICFVSDKKFYDVLKKTGASAVILSEKVETLSIPQVVVDDPYFAFVKLLNIIYSERQNFYKGIHPTSVFGENVKLGENAGVGPYCVVSNNVRIGKETYIGANVFIGTNVEIGDNVIIYPHVVIRENVSIGNNVIVHSGSVIGSDGFGYIKKNGKYVKIPQVGKVVIEDDVEIGANVTIDRATISETRIGKGTKIDNLVHIAHNVKIGENVLLLAQVGIAGSSKVGNNTILAGQTGVTDHIKIGENVIAGPRTGIVQDVEDNSIVWGTPPIPFSEQKKIAVASRRIPKLIVEFKELKQKLEKIEGLLIEYGLKLQKNRNIK
ncbi:MAG: UDP-3-O-(3-hydroxymyristoyl)glucosamine N-acyltransferase [Endomicrobia bacterium]|nr:UDP-3-O-(3-hydroxymyristoyl)glucosamine N-acyltransferase [Endomicrobiia bacterium]MDW8056204.1 UDP-3-O-(3-hydroxymyristoyl)glucosamine N-acyltransferase [Elusimicrobiota bacterium]